MINDPNWTAPRTGHDWRDDDVLRATTWFRSFVPAKEMEQRLEGAKALFLAARNQWERGSEASLYDQADAVAWYILQAETFAVDRQFLVPDAMARIVPFITRLGKELDLLRTVRGVEARAARMMVSDKRQPDSGLFELLVALAYRRGGWMVEFVSEQPGITRTPDLNVYRPRSRWAVECKRLVPSTYAARERARGIELAKPVHTLSLARGESVVVEVNYNIELAAVPDDYLVKHVSQAIDRRSLTPWTDVVATGQVRPVKWALARGVLKKDDVYYGSSRMIELLSGSYNHEADHSMAAKWRPATKRPLYAEAVYQASVVSWTSRSKEAATQKARHFKSTLAKAEGQLPADRPGVIHVGIEGGSGATIAAARHVRNFLEARHFRPTSSRLRWVYGNYFVPELTTAKHETWALTETMVPYKVGTHNTAWPLPNHMLLTPADKVRGGVHWDVPTGP